MSIIIIMKKLLRYITLSGIPISIYIVLRPFPKKDVSNIPEYTLLPTISHPNPNPNLLTKKPKTICIIGAGMAGLVTAKELTIQGYEVEVLDSQLGPGGVWYDPYDEAML